MHEPRRLLHPTRVAILRLFRKRSPRHLHTTARVTRGAIGSGPHTTLTHANTHPAVGRAQQPRPKSGNLGEHTAMAPRFVMVCPQTMQSGKKSAHRWRTLPILVGFLWWKPIHVRIRSLKGTTGCALRN